MDSEHVERAAVNLLPLPATQERGEGRGEGKALKTLTKNNRNMRQAPLSLTLSPLRREREFAPQGRLPCALISEDSRVRVVTRPQI